MRRSLLPVRGLAGISEKSLLQEELEIRRDEPKDHQASNKSYLTCVFRTSITSGKRSQAKLNGRREKQGPNTG